VTRQLGERLRIKPISLDDGDRLTLRNAILAQVEVTGAERKAIGQRPTDIKICGRQWHRNNIIAPVQTAPGNDYYRVRA
jgi:hypothetical protein